MDEFANLLTHGLGFILSILASIALMKIALERQETATILACGVYCFSLVGLYAASTLSHAFYDLTWRRFFRMLDQAFIYVLIAGSFTPFAVIFLGRGKPSLLLTAMWMLAFFGVLLVLRVRNLPSAAKVTYGVLGWLPIISLETFMHHAPFAMIVWIIAGGLFYSSGTVFLLFDQQVRYLHALWHTFVIAGSACHYIAILLLVTLM